ncbi:hypothetical protein A2U01_0116932, partial [Trifolium medium]|nr:hypothetical protein [Trifolium medium]
MEGEPVTGLHLGAKSFPYWRVMDRLCWTRVLVQKSTWGMYYADVDGQGHILLGRARR